MTINKLNLQTTLLYKRQKHRPAINSTVLRYPHKTSTLRSNRNISALKDGTLKSAEIINFWQSQSVDNQCLFFCQNVTSFTGKEKDSETGFYYFGARYYDPNLSGLFLSVDPMADKYPSISPYAYCAWNPVKLVDPDGKKVSYSKLLLNESFPQLKDNSTRGDPPLSKTKKSEQIISSITYVLPIALLDGPMPGPADAVTGISVTGIVFAAGVVKSLETIEQWIRVGNDYITQKMSQHGKKRISLSPEEVEKCNDILNNPKSTKKEKNEAKQKLKTHEKSQGERHSRQSNEKRRAKEHGKI